MAFRYNTSSGNNAFGSSSTSPFAANNTNTSGNANILGAGAFLRSNAVSGLATQKQQNEEEESEEQESEKEESIVENEPPQFMFDRRGSVTLADSPFVFGRSQAPTTSLAGALMSNLVKKGEIVPAAGESPAGGGVETKRRESLLGKGLTDLLARKLFHQTTEAKESDYDDGGDEEDYDEDGSGDATHVDRDFVRSANSLFSQVEPELLLDTFLPFEYVVQIIANDDGTEANESEIDERLAVYYELQEELDEMMGRYIEVHHDEFNEAVSGFSEMVLAISGSDEMLARLKQQLAMAASSFDSLAEQMQVLRMRAAKALLMAESLKGLENSLSCESEVKQLIATHHYLAAVQRLRQHKAQLGMPEVANIRATQLLRDYVNGTLDTMHETVAEDLMSCVFRQGRMYEADAQLVGEMLVDGASETTVGTIDALVVLHEQISQAEAKSKNTALTFSEVVNNIHDDPYDEEIVKNYLRFIPLCVKTMQELGKLECCYQTFFSKATRSIDQSISDFFRLYGAWRQRAVQSTSVAGSLDAATVQVTKLQAKGLASPTISYDEAIALVQRPELSAMLNALFAEIEKIVRNAEYLIKVILVAYFPFLSSCLMRPGGFSPDVTYREWDVTQTPLQNPDEMKEILTNALTKTLSKYGTQEKDGDGDNAELVALRHFLMKFHVDETFTRLETLTEGGVCLRSVQDAINEAAEEVIREHPDDDEEAMKKCCKELNSLTHSMVVQAFRRDVNEMYSRWDLQVLSSQLSYYTELIFRMLCDARELEEDFGDEIALKPFLKHRNLAGRVHRTAGLMSGSGVDTFPSLEKMLSTQDPSGLLAVMEQTGHVSFSIVVAVKYAQRDVKRSNEVKRRKSRVGSVVAANAFSSGGRIGATMLMQQATTLPNWFVLTPMNILTCYESVRRFYQRCAVRAPRFVSASREDMGKSFYHFLQKTYIPTLYLFHVQHLRRLFSDMSESESFSEEAAATGSGADTNKQPTSPTVPSHVSTEPLMHHHKVQQEGIKWPIVTLRQGGESRYPILTCVHYVGQVLQKISRICRTLPDHLAEVVQQNITETLLSELTMFLKKKVHRISHRTLYHHLLRTEFEETFSGRLSARWQTLCDEGHLLNTHNAIDADLFKYYALNNESRTSGHQYNRVAYDFAGGSGNSGSGEAVDKSKDIIDSGIDASIGDIAPTELALKGNGVVVAFAILCYSMEWLCDVALQTVWQDAWPYGSSTDCLVPGTVFNRRYERLSVSLSAGATSDGTRWVRLGGILRQMYTLSQLCLFYLSLEARFAAFQYIPQLRDESYNIVATAHSPDTFVQAYNRRIINFFALLKLHLSEQKLKYVGITVAKPLSDLIMVELAHLRDKSISPAGLTRLRANLLSIETALQLVLPTDDEVRDAVKRYFSRPATFLRHLPNKNVASDLITSGDYRQFSTREMEELIRLVFRREGNDEFVAAQIQLLQSRLKTVSLASTTQQVTTPPAASVRDNPLQADEEITQQQQQEEKEEKEEEVEEEEEEEEEEEANAVMQTAEQSISQYVYPPVKPASVSATKAKTNKVAASSVRSNWSYPPAPNKMAEEEEEEYEEEEEEDEVANPPRILSR